MPRQIITTANAPSSPLYSQGVKVGPHVFVSGTVGVDPSTGKLSGDTIQDQTRQALMNCQAILRAGGADLGDVIEVGILLTNPGDFDGLNDEYARCFASEPPTRYVAKLGVDLPGLLLDPYDSVPVLTREADHPPAAAGPRLGHQWGFLHGHARFRAGARRRT